MTLTTDATVVTILSSSPDQLASERLSLVRLPKNAQPSPFTSEYIVILVRMPGDTLISESQLAVRTGPQKLRGIPMVVVPRMVTTLMLTGYVLERLYIAALGHRAVFFT